VSIDQGAGRRVAIVGPTHPYKGGVAAHTTELAHRLAAAGHDTLLVSWSRLYPAALYPGEQAVPDGGPDLPPYPRTVRVLRWDRPGTWWRAGRRLRRTGVDVVVVVVVVPAQVPALLALVSSLRGRPFRTLSPGVLSPGVLSPADSPRVVVLAHNVVPHETHPGGEWLMSRIFRAADTVLAHSPRMAEQAGTYGARQALVADLPPHLPGGVSGQGVQTGGPAGASTAVPVPGAANGAAGHLTRVLAFGMVREYKGIDLLLEAAAAVPGVTVTVAGEQWGRAGERVRVLAADPRLAGRVRIEAGYVPGDRVPALLAAHDVLALPYRSATASQNVLLGHAHGLPVVVTDVGTLGSQVRDGVDGLVVPPGDVPALVGALREVSRPERLDALRRGVPAVDLDGPWQRYLETLLHDPGEEQR
jgi:glycosyltransferase involved in cell wall biosynthesis